MVTKLNPVLFLIAGNYLDRLLPASTAALAKRVVSLKVDFILLSVTVQSVRGALPQTFKNDVAHLFRVSLCEILRLQVPQTLFILGTESLNLVHVNIFQTGKLRSLMPHNLELLRAGGDDKGACTLKSAS